VSALPGLLIVVALSFLGAPYVWKGKGWKLWSPTGLIAHSFGRQVFDCSGLVTTSLLRAGGPDLIATHSAQTMFDQFAEAPDPTARGVLRFYGDRQTRVTHVAICMGPVNGKVEVLEAAGGDSRTDCPKPGACVRVGPELRRDYLGSRVLP